MSATAPQERLAKTTSWLAQLKGNAEWAGFTAEHAAHKAQERYGKPIDELTVSEAQHWHGNTQTSASRKQKQIGLLELCKMALILIRVFNAVGL